MVLKLPTILKKANELSVGGGEEWLAFKSIAFIYLFGIGGINKNIDKSHLYEDALNFDVVTIVNLSKS